MKKLHLLVLTGILIYACSCGNQNQQNVSNADTTAASTQTAAGSQDLSSYDPKRGEGKFTKVDVGEHLDAAMAAEGKKVYDVKCSSCHKLTDEKLVGPGWKGVIQRHEPVWIMNFATNPDAMLEKDPSARAMLEICLVRMPNQNLSDDEARHVLEFMRQNDGVK
jgi:cytochrome c2